MNVIIQAAIDHVTSQADLNGDKKVDRADWDLFVSLTKAKAKDETNVVGEKIGTYIDSQVTTQGAKHVVYVASAISAVLSACVTAFILWPK